MAVNTCHRLTLTLEQGFNNSLKGKHMSRRVNGFFFCESNLFLFLNWNSGGCYV